MITKLIGNDYRHWPDYLSPVCLAYNATIHTSTGYAPHELFYSFPPTCPLDVIVETDADDPVNTADQYALEATEHLREAFRFMRQYSGKQVECMKTNYDAAIRPKQFEVGKFVLLYVPKKKKNVYGRWHVSWQGPFRVMKRINQSNYVIQHSPRAQSFVVHGDRLRDFNGKNANASWPASILDADHGTRDAPEPDDPDPDGHQQQQPAT